MNITRDNFEKSFDMVSEAIHSSHFLAIDCEFTGLHPPHASKQQPMDSAEMRYGMGRLSASSFMVTQYGVCCFRFDEDGNLTARPFNFFVFPSTEFRADRVFSCQASSIDFLSKHGFDFQAWAAQGVPFLSRHQEEKIRKKIGERQAKEEEERKAAAGDPKKEDASFDGTTFDSLPNGDKDFVKSMRKKVNALAEEANSGDEYVERCLVIEPLNGRQRWLTYSFVSNSSYVAKFNTLSGPSYARGIEIRTVPQEADARETQEAKEREEAKAKLENDLRCAAGFRRVIDEICRAGKVIITHNGILDLLHTYDKFVGPLPDQEAEGAKALHSLFPMILDSKEVIAKAVAAGLEFPSSTLGDAFRWLCEFHAVKAAHCTNGGGETAEVDEGKLDTAKSIDETPKVARKAAAWQAAYASGFEERYACGGYEHEAAYDAYLTGCCFIAAATLGLGTSVEEMKNLKPGNEVPSSLGTVVNVMPLYRVAAGQKWHLPGPSPSPDFGNFLHVSGFPSEVRTGALLRPLSSVSGIGTVSFHWIDDTSGLAEFTTMKAAKTLLKAATKATVNASTAVPGLKPRTVDPHKLLLEDLHVTEAGKPAQGEVNQEGREMHMATKKRPREHEESAAEKSQTEVS